MRISIFIYFFIVIVFSALQGGAQGLPGKGDSWTEPPNDELRYGILCILNNTSMNIHYSYKWGYESDWKDTSVKSKYNRTHYWKYSDKNYSSPIFLIRFNKYPKQNQAVYQEYKLVKHAAADADCESGKKYSFEFVRNNGIDLFNK